MKECINCRNTAARDSCYCRRCEDAVRGETERDASFHALDMAICDLAHDEPTQRAFEAVRDLLRAMAAAS